MIQPTLGNAFPAVLARELCLNDDGELLADDNPENWDEADATTPTMVRLADLRVSLLSVSLDEVLVRAVYEVEGFSADSPIGPTEPAMGDVVALEVVSGIHMNYRIDLTSAEVRSGVDADIGVGELLLRPIGCWLEPED